uniref:Secretory carrier-associated membrane protein n=1 Tax=Oryzias latipes TaxID=8090 RepID=A0A3P9INN8_ORYLA
MSEFDSNPFADPVDVNPFQVSVGTVLPLSSQTKYSGTTIPISGASSQPAVLQTSVEQSPQATAAAAQAKLEKQQEELEKKAAELERKEQELQNRNARNKENNWPPLPRFCPVKPCFYQDFEEEISEDYRQICKRMYYLWMYHSATLFLNVLACLAYFTADPAYGVDFGLSILWFMLFTPVSFICWYRPVYKAFRGTKSSDESLFYSFCLISGSGWISAISMIGTNLAVAVVMMVVAGFFTVNAILAIILLKMVHSRYRGTGASFTKAQQEFSQGVLTSRTFQGAAATAATSAAQGAFGRSQGN